MAALTIQYKSILMFFLFHQVTSLLSLDGVRLRNLFCDVKGAHIADVFLKSQNIGEKSRDALVKNLQVCSFCKFESVCSYISLFKDNGYKFGKA
jgi:hypothetical protein